MPFKDLPEGTTHNDKDDCFKCIVCGGHFMEFSPSWRCNKCIELNIKEELIEKTSKDVAGKIKTVLNKLK